MQPRPLPPAPGSLGPLETSVMEAMWSLGREASVRDVQVVLSSGPAYTTVMTTMERLYRKGLLGRRRLGRAFLYAAALSRDGLAGSRARGFIGQLLDAGASATPVLTSFVDAVGDRDRALLDHLEEMIRAKRKEVR